jgi:hypothetical protein
MMTCSTTAGGDFDSFLESLACDELIVSDDVDLHSVYSNNTSSLDLSLDDCSSMETTSLNLDDFLSSFCLQETSDTSASRTDENQMRHMSEDNKLSLCTFSSTSKSFMNPVQESPLLCGFQRCSFEGPDWDAMASHRRKEHSQHGDFKYRYRCPICNKHFFHKSTLVRHRRECGGQCLLYCPDCPTLAPSKRVDNYYRHRRKRHGEKDGAIKPYSKSPPPGYRRPSGQKYRFVIVDFR